MIAEKLRMKANTSTGFAHMIGALAIVVFSSLLTGVPGYASEPEMSDKAERVMEKYVRTGEMVNCLGIRQISSIKPLDDRYFLVKARGNQYYLNIVSRGCNRASRSNTRIQYTTSSALLCQNEIIRVVENTSDILSGSCGLGKFERLDEKEQPAED